MTATWRSGMYLPADYCDSLDAEGTTKCRNAAAALVLDAIEQAARADGITGTIELPDDALDEHNRMIRELWICLDHLALWAGGRPFFGYTRGNAYAERRGQLARACCALLSQIDADAEIAEVEITAHNTDGTTISYYTTPSQNWSQPRPVGRIIHGDDGCTEIPSEEAP